MRRTLLLTIGTLMISTAVAAQSANDKAIIDGIMKLIQTKPKQAVEEAQKAIQKDKKNIALIMGIGDVYIRGAKFDEAEDLSDYLSSIIKEGDKNRSKVYMLRGDILAAQKQTAEACALYDRAIFLNPGDADAYNRYAETFIKDKPELAIGKLKELVEHRPDMKNAVNKRIGHLYYMTNDFDGAANAYDEVEESAMEDKDIIEHAMSNFFNRSFDRSLAAAEVGHKKNPRKAEFNRLIMYNNTDLKNYTEALAAADNLFHKSDSAKFSFLDYTYYGYALMGVQDYQNAVAQFNKALAMNEARSDVMAQLSAAYEEMGDFDKALELYNKFMNSLEPEQRTLEVTFRLGRLYYTHASNEGISAAEKRRTLASADSVFAVVAQLAPTSHMGNFWRARTNSMLDPESEQGLAKPYYEAVADLLEEKNDPARYSSTLMECYRYLGYYYFLKKNKTNSAYYWEQVLKLDPENAIAKRALEFVR